MWVDGRPTSPSFEPFLNGDRIAHGGWYGPMGDDQPHLGHTFPDVVDICSQPLLYDDRRCARVVEDVGESIASLRYIERNGSHTHENYGIVGIKELLAIAHHESDSLPGAYPSIPESCGHCVDMVHKVPPGYLLILPLQKGLVGMSIAPLEYNALQPG